MEGGKSLWEVCVGHAEHQLGGDELSHHHVQGAYGWRLDMAFAILYYQDGSPQPQVQRASIALQWTECAQGDRLKVLAALYTGRPTRAKTGNDLNDG